MIKHVTLLFRHPCSFFSIEQLFDTVSAHLPASIDICRLAAPMGGASIRAIFTNLCWAKRASSSVFHITGDIHYVAIILPKRQTILTIHDLRSIKGPSSLKKRLLKLLWFTLPARRVRYITVVSEATRQELLRYIKVDPAKVCVIPNCLDPLFTYCPKEFDSQCPVILQVGTTDNKNIHRLVKALSGIPCYLKILGQPTEEQFTLLEKSEINYSWVAGVSQEQVVELYRVSDLVAFVSTYEGFGFPIIEAQAIGRPVITSNVSSMPEVAGEAALLVNPFDIKAIREGILLLIRDDILRKSLIEKGRTNAQCFTATKVASQYASLYHEVMEK